MKRTFHMYICWRKWEHDRDVGIELCDHPVSKGGMWTGGVIGEVDVEVDLPDDFDERAAQLEALRMEKQKVTARLTAEITRIDHEIGKLLALEHKEPA